MAMQMFIDGQWTSSASGKTFSIVSPASGESLGAVPLAARCDVGQGVAAARAAQKSFAKLTAFARADLCHKIADIIIARRDELSRFLSLEQGKPQQAEALGEVDVTALFFRMAAEDAKRLEGTTIPSEEAAKLVFTTRVPRGVYGIITPWNFPFAIPAQYLAGVIATGNTAIWVPALTTAGCAVKLMECLVEARVPAGVINLITGEGAEVGDEVAGHPGIDAIGLTGSSATGAIVAKRAAGKPQLLELGGNAPTIVFPDADLERAAQQIGRGAFWNAGQICDSTERVLVHEKIHEPFVNALLQVADEFQIGHPLETGTTMGPVHSRRQADQVMSHINDAVKKGARVLKGGGLVEEMPTKLYIAPTIIDRVGPDMLLSTEETFGPVAPVMSFDSEEEAVAAANSSSTGLLAAVFTRDLSRAFRVAQQLEAGIVNINETSTYWQPRTPFGGYSGKKSGMGRLGGRAILEEMTQVKSYVIDIRP